MQIFFIRNWVILTLWVLSAPKTTEQVAESAKGMACTTGLIKKNGAVSGVEISIIFKFNKITVIKMYILF